MSLVERYGYRSGVYSRWHRPTDPDGTPRLARFLPVEVADTLSQIDIDHIYRCDVWCEYEKQRCSEPLFLIETAEDVGQENKPATVTANLARRASIPAYVVLFTPTADGDDIERFRVKRIVPTITGWRDFTPAAYAMWLAAKRAEFACKEHTG